MVLHSMVFYFESNVVSPPITLFMGIDKYENEKLIEYGWPEDVWFHVSNLSSAHVYLRLKPDQTIDDIPQAVLDDAAQLVKANSITGNKTNNIEIVYTLWSNLRKTADMEVGQVDFHDDKQVRKLKVAKRVKDIVNRLNKTKKELYPDLKQEREQRDRDRRESNKQRLRVERNQKLQADRDKREKEKLKSYESLMSVEKMSLNTDNDGNDSDDFM